jgi:HK97 family phage portal protein
MGLFRRDRTPAVREPVEVVEQRDPTAATRSLRWTTPGRIAPPDWDATYAFKLANNTVLTCVNIVGNYIMECDFRVGADPSKPDDYDLRHPLARLLGPPPGGPNPTTSGGRLLKWTVGQRMMSGRYGWEIELNGDRPVALWALPTSSLHPVPSTSGLYYFDRFEFGPYNQRRVLPRERVFYDWLPSAEDWRQPDPPLRAAHLDLLVAVMQSRYDYAFLKNDAKPSTVVVTEVLADRDAKRAFEEQWNSTYRGPDNAGKVAVLEAEGAEPAKALHIETVGFSPRDSQDQQRYEFRLHEIAQALGVPWSLIDASGRTYDNAAQEWHNFLHGTLKPLASDLANAINMQLAPRFGQNVGWFDLRPLGIERRTDPITSPATAPLLVQAQLMTINEARADYALPPMPGGDRMMTAEEIAALRGGPSLEPASRAAAPEVREVPVAAPAPPSTEPPAPLPEDRGETAEEAEARRTKIWNANNSTVRNLERAWEKRLTALFSRQRRSALARLEHKRSRRVASEVRALVDEVFDRSIGQSKLRPKCRCCTSRSWRRRVGRWPPGSGSRSIWMPRMWIGSFSRG